MKAILSLFFFLLLVNVVSSKRQQFPVTVGTSISQAEVQAHQEYELYEYQGAGVLTYFWIFCKESDKTNQELVIRYYVDNNGPIEFKAGLLAGIGFDNGQSPWGTPYAGKGSTVGSIYSTLRVPFANSIRITVQQPDYRQESVLLRWTTRINQNTPIVIADYTIPSSAVLKLYKNDHVSLKPLQYLTLVNTTHNGAVWMVTLAISSGDDSILQGCVRMINGKNTTLLSSGTEDYFQSANQFDAGSYYFPEAGVTSLMETSSEYQLSAYKIHDRDAIFFNSGRFQLVWRNGEMVNPMTGLKCVDTGKAIGSPKQSNVTSYAWVYEW